MEGGKQQPKGHQVPLGGCLHTGQGSPKIRFSFRDKYFKKMKHQGEVQSGKINNTDSYSWSHPASSNMIQPQGMSSKIPKTNKGMSSFSYPHLLVSENKVNLSGTKLHL